MPTNPPQSEAAKTAALEAESRSWDRKISSKQAEIARLEQKVGGESTPPPASQAASESETTDEKTAVVRDSSSSSTPPPPPETPEEADPSILAIFERSNTALKNLNILDTKARLAPLVLDVDVAYRLLEHGGAVTNGELPADADLEKLIPASLQKSKGIPGTGSHGSGGVATVGLDPYRARHDFAYYEAHRDEIIEARRKGTI